VADVILFGDGQDASLAHYYFARDTDHHVVGFTVDGRCMQETTFMDLPVVPFEEVARAFPPSAYKMHISVAYTRLNRLRAEKYYAAKELGYELLTYISSKATVCDDLVIGDNCFIGEHAVIQPYASIGNNVVVHPGSHIGHHTTVEDHCFLSVNVTILGAVTVAPYCMFGGNSTVRNRVNVARESVVGAGALILCDTKERGVYVGNPSRLHPIPSDRLDDKF
jgi:sugar O-acyltransferase (sialic acid O-acetyltransferase NeuD family)